MPCHDVPSSFDFLRLSERFNFVIRRLEATRGSKYSSPSPFSAAIPSAKTSLDFRSTRDTVPVSPARSPRMTSTVSPVLTRVLLRPCFSRNSKDKAALSCLCRKCNGALYCRFLCLRGCVVMILNYSCCRTGYTSKALGYFSGDWSFNFGSAGFAHIID